MSNAKGLSCVRADGSRRGGAGPGWSPGDAGCGRRRVGAGMAAGDGGRAGLPGGAVGRGAATIEPVELQQIGPKRSLCGAFAARCILRALERPMFGTCAKGCVLHAQDCALFGVLEASSLLAFVRVDVHGGGVCACTWRSTPAAVAAGCGRPRLGAPAGGRAWLGMAARHGASVTIAPVGLPQIGEKRSPSGTFAPCWILRAAERPMVGTFHGSFALHAWNCPFFEILDTPATLTFIEVAGRACAPRPRHGVPAA